MSDEEKQIPAETSGDTAEAEKSEGVGSAGDFLIGVVCLIIGIWCIKDGWWPPEGWEAWKVTMNKVIAIVGIVAGLAVIVRALLRPRSSAAPDESEQDADKS